MIIHEECTDFALYSSFAEVYILFDLSTKLHSQSVFFYTILNTCITVKFCSKIHLVNIILQPEFCTMVRGEAYSGIFSKLHTLYLLLIVNFVCSV